MKAKTKEQYNILQEKRAIARQSLKNKRLAKLTPKIKVENLKKTPYTSKDFHQMFSEFYSGIFDD